MQFHVQVMEHISITLQVHSFTTLDLNGIQMEKSLAATRELKSWSGFSYLKKHNFCTNLTAAVIYRKN